MQICGFAPLTGWRRDLRKGVCTYTVYMHVHVHILIYYDMLLNGVTWCQLHSEGSCIQCQQLIANAAVPMLIYQDTSST